MENFKFDFEDEKIDLFEGFEDFGCLEDDEGNSDGGQKSVDEVMNLIDTESNNLQFKASTSTDQVDAVSPSLTITRAPYLNSETFDDKDNSDCKLKDSIQDHHQHKANQNDLIQKNKFDNVTKKQFGLLSAPRFNLNKFNSDKIEKSPKIDNISFQNKVKENIKLEKETLKTKPDQENQTIESSPINKGLNKQTEQIQKSLKDQKNNKHVTFAKPVMKTFKPEIKIEKPNLLSKFKELEPRKDVSMFSRNLFSIGSFPLNERATATFGRNTISNDLNNNSNIDFNLKTDYKIDPQINTNPINTIPINTNQINRNQKICLNDINTKQEIKINNNYDSDTDFFLKNINESNNFLNDMNDKLKNITNKLSTNLNDTKLPKNNPELNSILPHKNLYKNRVKHQKYSQTFSKKDCQNQKHNQNALKSNLTSDIAIETFNLSENEEKEIFNEDVIELDNFLTENINYKDYDLDLIIDQSQMMENHLDQLIQLKTQQNNMYRSSVEKCQSTMEYLDKEYGQYLR